MTKKDFRAPEFLFDRIILIYNGEDFIMDIIKKIYDLRVIIVSSFNSPRMIELRAKEYLNKMRISDFENEFKVYETNPFLSERKEEFDEMIRNNSFGFHLTKKDIIAEGIAIHQKVFDYIEKKLNN